MDVDLPVEIPTFNSFSDIAAFVKKQQELFGPLQPSTLNSFSGLVKQFNDYLARHPGSDVVLISFLVYIKKPSDDEVPAVNIEVQREWIDVKTGRVAGQRRTK